MKTRFSSALLLIPFSLLANESDSDLLKSLTNDMTIISKTAKIHRENIDYLPYIMTVFDGEELSHAGASSLKEALALVAGVNIASDNLSLFNPVFRGSNPVAYGQSKLIVDGIEVNDLFFDGYTAYLTMPIDMIKRIEVVRGPGNYSNGHSGYAGSIMVTTYKGEASEEGGRWFTSIGNYGTKKAGASYASSHDNFSFAADFYTVHDNLSLSYEKDGLSNNLLGTVNAPLSRSGGAPSATDATMLSASISKGAFFADGRLSSYRHGSGGGINYALASDDDHYNIDQWQVRTGAHYTAADFTGTLQAVMVQDSFTSNSLLGPAGLILPSLTPPTVAVTYPNGFYGISEAIIRTYQVNNTIEGTIYGGDATFGVGGSWSSVVSEKTLSTDRDSGIGMTDYSATRPFFNPDGFIRKLNAYVNYERPLSSSWIGYASLTVEKRNTMNAQIAPRIAAIYTIDSDNSIKISVSHAHRNPSWQEMFTLNNKARWGNPELLPETVTAYESQFIHRFDIEHTLSLNLFQLDNSNQIYLQYNTPLARYEYINGLKSTIRGIESEWRKRYDTTTFYAAYTHVLAEDGNGITLANTPSDTLRGFISHDLYENWYGSVSGRWQGSTPRASADLRDDMKAIGIIDATIGYKLPHLHSEIQFSVKNLFNERELYPSPNQTYNGDYPAIGRTFMATLRGTF
ncbi:MAG: TonB-dependent receptor plug domain-containing protein [Sulfuricurvum sp.]|nr:TonB-dependent receptor plug domain-containing protein [Sulfuricurvum sp.]